MTRVLLTERPTGLWTLDPIDDTKGFLRGEQYAIRLALLVDARVRLGLMGCLSLFVSVSNYDGPRDRISVSIRGQGAHQERTKLTIPFPACGNAEILGERGEGVFAT